jgi:hypothetical protein
MDEEKKKKKNHRFSFPFARLASTLSAKSFCPAVKVALSGLAKDFVYDTLRN